MESTNDGSRAITKFKFSDFVIMLVLVILCLTCVLPFIHLGAKSLSADTYVVAKKVFLWPKGFTTTAYKAVFEDGRLVYSFGYSVVLTAIFTLLGMVVCTCAAYPLSRRRLKGRNVLSFVLMVPMYFSAGLIPTYVLMNDLNLIDNMWGLILPLIFSPYNMLIMKSFLQSSIPDTLEEAAFLDGATNFQVLGKVVLPLSKPIIATLSLFYAVGRWNSYADAKYYIRLKEKFKPIQLLLSEMVSTASEASSTAFEAVVNIATPEVLQAAAIMFVTIPIICVYPFVQKYFVKGVMIGAVKG
ncbi:MAG: carbohydrate ABC transporter permease [Lachnospiraceae bacterium]|nr:carbohydrate ABC transporter permease [Lachnospiraceae bacterium]